MLCCTMEATLLVAAMEFLSHAGKTGVSRCVRGDEGEVVVRNVGVWQVGCSGEGKGARRGR